MEAEENQPVDAAARATEEVLDEQVPVVVEMESRPVDATIDLAPRRKVAAVARRDDDDDDPNARRRAIVADNRIEVDMKMLRDLQEKKRAKEREEEAREEELSQVLAEAAAKAHTNAQAVFLFVRSLSELVEHYLPRDDAGAVIQSYANFAVEHFLLSIGAISRSSLVAGGRSVIRCVDDIQKSRPIQTWGDFVQRIITLMKRHPLPPPPSMQQSTLRKIVRTVNGKTTVETVDLMMTDAFWMATRERISNWMGSMERDIDLSLLPELLERLRGIPLHRVGAAMRAVSRDMASVAGISLEASNMSIFGDSAVKSDDNMSASFVVVGASEAGGQRPFSPLERFAPCRKTNTPPPLMAPLLHSSEHRLPHLQAVAVLASEVSHYGCGLSPVVTRSCSDDTCSGPAASLAKNSRLRSPDQAPRMGTVRFPMEPTPEALRPHTLFDPVAVLQAQATGRSSLEIRKTEKTSKQPPSRSSKGQDTPVQPSESPEDMTLRSRLLASGSGVDPDEAINASLRHASQRRLAKMRVRRPVRMVALQGLVGMHEPVPGEALETYWQRLLSFRFKLSVLRGSGMPLDQRNLWKQLWDACFEAIDNIGDQLRSDILGHPTAAAADDLDAELRQLVDSVISNAVDEHLQLDRRLTDFSRRAMSRFDEIVTASTACSPSSGPPRQQNADVSEKSFARPVTKKDRGMSFLDEEFLRNGVAAINNIVDRQLAAAKTQHRPASRESSSSTTPARTGENFPTKNLSLCGNAPNGFALGMRLNALRPASRNSPPAKAGTRCEPSLANDSLRVSSAPMSLR